MSRSAIWPLFGTGGRDRTADLRVQSATLYQLSYSRSLDGLGGLIRTTDLLLPRQAGTTRLPYTQICLAATPEATRCPSTIGYAPVALSASAVPMKMDRLAGLEPAYLPLRRRPLLQLSYRRNWHPRPDSSRRSQLEGLASWPLDDGDMTG
jgi:hypothetical protein